MKSDSGIKRHHEICQPVPHADLFGDVDNVKKIEEMKSSNSPASKFPIDVGLHIVPVRGLQEECGIREYARSLFYRNNYLTWVW